MRKNLYWVFIFLTLFGIMDTGYLAYKHYTRDPLTCSIINGCDQVTTSVYSELYGIPLAYLGVLFYAVMLLLALLYMKKQKRRIAQIFLLGTAAGFLASIWFMYLQVFVIKALCEYCMVSALLSTLLCMASIAWYRSLDTAQ